VSRDRRTGGPVPPNGGRSITRKQVELRDYSLARVFRTHGETRPDPGRPRRIPRVVAEARLVAKTPLDLERARRYGNCLVEYVYAPTRVIRGELDEESIVVVHWAVHHGKVMPSIGKFVEGRSYRLNLEDWYWHRELKTIARKSVYIDENPFPARFYSVPKTR
jgi:hypothetical protein